MPRTTLDIDAMTTLLHNTADELVRPRFRALDQADILHKETAGDPHDIVTIVDREVEARLTAHLHAIDPDATVIGEEAVHADPDLLSRLESSGTVWLIDPIDGTKNFARGNTGFGMMLARTVAGVTTAAWMYLPERHETYVAELGGGLFLNGSRVKTPLVAPTAMPRGTVHTRYIPAAMTARIAESGRDRYTPLPDVGAAAVTYAEILGGQRDFDVFYRLLPWDFAPGALLLHEGGGTIAHVNGVPYSPRSTSQLTIVAASPDIAAEVSTWLLMSVVD
jgi:fructose-1,6-bisphosphatase/inositol monophosphatase family enzyme